MLLRALPYGLSGIEFLVALSYMARGDFPRAVYWGCASILTCSTTFMK